MGMLGLARIMSMKRRRRRRRRIQADGSSALDMGRKDSRSRSGSAKRRGPHLTLDRLPRIIALLPMQDAARAACASRELLQSWRHYPELKFSAKTLAMDGQHNCIQGQMDSYIKRIDIALQNCTGGWVKRFRFELQFFHELSAHHINHWLDAAIPGIEELTLELPRDDKMKYKFPCKLLFEKGCSIQSLCLYSCAFHPDQGACSFRNLKRVYFSLVHITTEELWIFLYNSLSLEHLELGFCHKIACLKIPCTLQLLNFLRVRRCNMLQIILSLGDSLQLKHVNISIYPWFNLFEYARKQLPTVAPNVETLFLMSANEAGIFYPLIFQPHGRFLHLKYLELVIVGPRNYGFGYQYTYLVTFLKASPVLETFILHVESAKEPYPLVINPKYLKNHLLPEHCHQSIKHVTVTGFCHTQELVELIFYILENATSLQCLTLDNRIRGFEKDLVACITQDAGTCDYQEWWKNFGAKEIILHFFRRESYPKSYWDAYCSYVAIRKYIIGRVPSSVELKIYQLCLLMKLYPVFQR
uniref:At1g61320/AtMIF1 LRR domain-containing protein n=2 Tax=Oryza rufipogon TaxID=4529 RepID=A0A0E0PBF5_ORYRU